MEFLRLALISLLLSGCGWGAGGADYYYTHTNADGSGTEIKVHSAREIDTGVRVSIGPDGNATIETGPLSSGANNLGCALNIMDRLTSGATKVAIP